MEFKFVYEVLYYQVKQTKTHLQKYFHPSFINHLIYAHVQKGGVIFFEKIGHIACCSRLFRDPISKILL